MGGSREKASIWCQGRQTRYTHSVAGTDIKRTEQNAVSRPSDFCFLPMKFGSIKQVIHRGASPTGSQSQAIGEQESLHAAGCRQAKHSEPRRASGQSAVAVQLFQVAGSASSGIQCFAGDVVGRQMVEGRAESTRCGPVGMVSYVVGGSMSGIPELVGAVRVLKAVARWLGRRQQILEMGSAASTGTVSSSEMLAVKTVQPSRHFASVIVRSLTRIPCPLPWQAH